MSKGRASNTCIYIYIYISLIGRVFFFQINAISFEAASRLVSLIPDLADVLIYGFSMIACEIFIVCLSLCHCPTTRVNILIKR